MLQSTTRFALYGFLALPLLVIASCKASPSSKCIDHQRLTQKELAEMISFYSGIVANPLLAADNAKVERANYFNQHTSDLLDTLDSVCGESEGKAWTNANMSLLIEAQNSIGKFKELRDTINKLK